VKLKLKITLVIIIISSLLARQINAQVATGSSFDKDNYYQGDAGKITITILNDHIASTIETSVCYLQYDWQGSNNYFDSHATPNIPTGSSYTFTISFNIPQNISVGNHVYKVIWIDKDSIYGNVTVKSGLLYIHDVYERTYYNIFDDVVNKYLQANPIGSIANSLVKQAENTLSLAGTLSKQGMWKEAVTKLNEARGLLEQANTSSEETINLYRMIIIGFIVISIIILGVLFYLRYKREKEYN
jgi:hypothetical protein